MARREQAREDLLAEATALVERIELALPDDAEHIVIGFRAVGAASLYFGEDPAFHFNSRSQLRRAYVAGRLLKAERGRLVAMSRERTEHEVRLASRELSDDETRALLANLQQRITTLDSDISGNRIQIIGQVPTDRDLLGRVRDWLETFATGINVAASPHVG